MPQMLRLQPDQLHPDQPLPWNVFDGEGRLLLRKGFLLSQDDQIARLIERGVYVIEKEYQSFKAGEAVELYDPLLLCESVQAHLAYVLEALPRDGTLQPEIMRLARQVMMLTERSADLVMALATLKDPRNYPIAHSFHVACIADMVARRAQWPKAKRLSLISAALTMNVGMLRLQMTLFVQRDPVSAAQRRAIDMHPTEGARILITCGVSDDEWLRGVLEHHETGGGTGYPRKVTDPSDLAQLLRIADVFAAKISPRSHRKPMMASEATKAVFTLYSENGKNPFPALLVKEIGIYPPGAIVRLANGETGVVQARGANAKTPIVCILINAHGMPVLKPVIRDTSRAPDYAVAGAIPRDKAMLSLSFEQIWGAGPGK